MTPEATWTLSSARMRRSGGRQNSALQAWTWIQIQPGKISANDPDAREVVFSDRLSGYGQPILATASGITPTFDREAAAWGDGGGHDLVEGKRVHLPASRPPAIRMSGDFGADPHTADGRLTLG